MDVEQPLNAIKREKNFPWQLLFNVAIIIVYK